MKIKNKENKLEKIAFVALLLFLAQAPLVNADIDLMLNVTEPMYPIQYTLTMAHESDQAGATWIWNNQTVETNTTPGKVYSHLFDFSNHLGMNNITYMGTNSGNFTTSLLNGDTGFSLTISPSGNLKNTSFLIYMAPRFIVPDNVSLVNMTTLPVLVAPGEQINFTTTISPTLASDPGQWIFEGNGSALLLNSTSFSFVSNSTNGISKNYTFSAMANLSYNGTMLLRVNTKTLALKASHQAIEGSHQIVSQSDLESLMSGLSVAKNITAGQIKISPRSDVNGNFQKGDIQDLTTIRKYINLTQPKPASFCPRCDIKLPYDSLITMADYNQAVAEKGAVITV